MGNSFQTEWEAPELESLASLAENLVYRIPGCDDTILRKTLQEVAREFVADTQCLTSHQVLEPDDGGMCYPAPRFGGKVADVREVWKFRRHLRKGVDWNWPIGTGIRIAPHLLPRPEVANASPAVPKDAIRYAPRTNLMDAAPEFRAPPVTPFSAVVVEHLPLFYEDLPKWFLQKHGDAICSGVLGRLFAMTGKPWSDAQQAHDERIRYDNFKSEERMRREMPSNGRSIDMSEVL